MPPMPSLKRVGVRSDETLPLTLMQAIRRALENNNDIEVARDDVRFAETQLRSLEGVYDPFLSFTPQIDKRITPVQKFLPAAVRIRDKFRLPRFRSIQLVTKSFSTGGGLYQLSFSNIAKQRRARPTAR